MITTTVPNIGVNDTYTLKRSLLYLYEDNLITTSLIDGLYEFIRSKSIDITFFNFNDMEKSMIFKVISTDFSSLELEIKNWFSHFITNLIFNPSLSYLLTREYNNIEPLKSRGQNYIFSLAHNCITILNISVIGNEIAIKINLID